MKLKKAICVLLAMATALPVVACRGHRDPGGVTINESQTQLYVSVYSGGVGTEWFTEAVRGFEAKYAETSFEDGKKGVQIVPETNKSNTAGDTLLAGLKSNNNDVYFTEAVYYYDIISQGGAADITDIVTGKPTEFGEEKTIESKMDQALIDFYKTEDGKYYALPWYEGYMGFIYNVQLFEDEFLYFKDGYRDEEYLEDMFISDLSDKRSKGPDNIEGTRDDGLPATYDDFYKLCERMVDLGITPFIWPGMYSYVTSYVAYQMWADYEGRDQFYLNFSFDGTANDLVKSIDANGVVTLEDPTTITNQNGVDVQKQRGKYEVLKFWENILRPADETDRFYHDLSFSPSMSNTSAQATFLSGIVDSANRVGMLVDGNWWEREAESIGSFTNLANRGYNKADLRFGFMPFPKADDSKLGDKRTLVSINDSLCFVSGRSTGARLQLAKLFLQYCHTDAMLQDFSVKTNMMKPYNYEISAENQAKLTYFGKEMYAIKDPNNNVDVVYPYSGNAVFLNNFAEFHPYNWAFTIPEGNSVAAIFADTSLTAKEYFEKLYPAYKTKWTTYLSKIN